MHVTPNMFGQISLWTSCARLQLHTIATFGQSWPFVFWSIFGPCCFSSKTELGVVLETYLFYNLLNSEYWFRLNLQKDLHLARPELRNGIRPSWCTVRCKKQSWLQIWWPTMQSSDSKIEIGMLTRSKICVECTGWRYREHSWTTWAQLQKANCWFYTKE